MASTNDGFIRVFNNGGFLACFNVMYSYNGKSKSIDSSVFPVLSSDVINIPEGATDIRFEVYIAISLTNWVSIYSQFFDSTPKACFNLTGVTFDYHCVQINCPEGVVGGEAPSKPSCCYCCCKRILGS